METIMFGWLKVLFGKDDDRPAKAQERINLAMEGIASDLEEARGNLRVRLGLEGGTEPLALPDGKAKGKRKVA